LTANLAQKLPISGVLITLNAATQLEATLNSLQFCHEIIVVDSGSTDGTCEIAKKTGATVIQQPWLGFGAQKQFAVAQAQFDWVLCVDADEQISPALQKSIRIHITEQTHTPDDLLAGFEFARSNYFMGRFLRHGEGYPDYSKRLFNRQRANWSNDTVHEKVEKAEPRFQFKRIAGDLLHQSAETIYQYLQKQNRYTDIQAELIASQNKKPSASKVVFSPIIRFVKFYVFKLGFLDGLPGFVHISIGCFNGLVKYAKVRELLNKKIQKG